MRPIRITLAPSAAADNNLAASQSPAAAALTLTALASATGGLDPQTGTKYGLGRIIILTSGGDDSGITFAVVGKDQNGAAVTETITGANAGVAASTKYYTSITSITPSASVATTVKVGTRGTTSSAAFNTIALNLYGGVGSTVQIDVSGTISYTVQHTYDDCLASTGSAATFFATPATPTALTAQSAAKYCQLPPGTCGISVTIPTYSTNGSIVVNVVSPCGNL